MNPTPLEEHELKPLIALAQKGDTEAFGRIYDHFFPSVYRFTAFRLPTELAEDLVAEIFVQAWEKLHTYKPQKNIPFSAWLFRIARHKIIDSYRAHKGWEEMPEEIVDPDDLNRADTNVRRKELLQIVRKALDKLPKRYNEVLQLSFIGGLPNKEVASVMRVREGTVRILKHRALKKLEGYLPAEIRNVEQES